LGVTNRLSEISTSNSCQVLNMRARSVGLNKTRIDIVYLCNTHIVNRNLTLAEPLDTSTTHVRVCDNAHLYS
jgi:hypothetical protein